MKGDHRGKSKSGVIHCLMGEKRRLGHCKQFQKQSVYLADSSPRRGEMH